MRVSIFIQCLPTLFPDLTKVIGDLYKADLATDKNLILLFGGSGFASYRLWELQQQREDNRQQSIESFVTHSRIWKEGCIDNDKRSGLKIKYLTKMDRQERFEEAKRLMPVGKYVRYLEPSLERFVKKFGWDNLGLGDECRQYLAGYSAKKRQRCDLDGFLTLEEACQHFFDTLTFEEAIWDLVGIPRLVVLNGDEEKMLQFGWKRCFDAVLGEKSVQLGSRVAYVYSESCTIWEEQPAT